MADEKLRLLLFEECDRDCPGCCNRDWDLRSLPVCRDFTPYQVIMLTGDCLPFWRFDQSTQSLDGKSLRLNIFEEVGPVASSERWQVKDHMAWIPNCPLPQGEVLMRLRPYGG